MAKRMCKSNRLKAEAILLSFFQHWQVKVGGFASIYICTLPRKRAVATTHMNAEGSATEFKTNCLESATSGGLHISFRASWLFSLGRIRVAAAEI